MASWTFSETFAVLAIGRSLAYLLAGVAGYCVIAGLVISAWDIHVFAGGSAASAINTVILGLLMNFRNRTAYARWWEARGLWGQLTNDSRNLAVKLAAFVPGEALTHAHAAELLAGFAEALKRHLRDGTTRLRDLPGFESTDADPTHVPMYLAAQLYAAFADWRRAGLIDGTVLWILDAHLRRLLDVAGACEKIRHTPLAPSYKTLLRAGLFLDILSEPWLTMPDTGFWSVPAFLLACFFLLGVELIDTVVEEPFGPERDDLDLDRYCRTIRAGVCANLPLAAEPNARP